MQTDDLERIADSMREEADDLWERMEKCNQLPIIQAPNVINTVGPTAGRLRGWAGALEYLANHNNGGE